MKLAYILTGTVPNLSFKSVFFMKKLVLLFVISILISSCGVKRPYAPTISSISGQNAAGFYSNNTGLSVSAYSLYDVRLDWNVTETGAQGVKILISRGDSYCENPFASATLYITDTTNIQASPLTSLAQMIINYGGGMATLNQFVPGRYAFCISAVLYGNVSDPSWPVFLDLLPNGGSGMGYFNY